MSYIYLKDEAGAILVDENGAELFVGSVNETLMPQICMWSFDDLIDWDKCQPEQ